MVYDFKVLFIPYIILFDAEAVVVKLIYID
jgi:hypothetical protein